MELTYIESPKWLKDKKCCINQKNNDNKCFQYAATLALNINSINKHQEYQKLNPLLIIIIGVIIIFLQPKKIGINLKLIIKI